VTREGPRLDEAGAVRRGEELNVAALHAWLASRLPDLTGTPRVTQFPGGASNWTYRLEYERHDLIVRRPPAGTKARTAHDMGREYRLQAALAPVFPFVPEMLACCEDASILGAEFYVMRRVPGIILRRSLPAGLTLAPDAARRLCTRALDTLVALHQVDYAAAGLAHLGKGAGYTRRQVEGWIGRYRAARTWNVPRGNRVAAWLTGRLPQAERICLTHNDYRLDNLVLDATDPTRIVAVLDWELAALGNPLMDVGNMLAYWVQADDDPVFRGLRRQPTHLPGMLTRREVLDYYSERAGIEAPDWTFYEVFGLFRLAGIAQQIYYRYHHRQTRNPAFRRFWLLVTYLHVRCLWRMRVAASSPSPAAGR
jgi:aminoglycoside phosphotransferase (APT) family kinase protein